MNAVNSANLFAFWSLGGEVGASMAAPTKKQKSTHAQEIARRRTFAIISHPDAGKTTLTEKLLLYGGALHLAGSVTARKNQNSTASDWMELEKQRAISVSSTVLQFEYGGCCVNLLDTPGHRDFSEDTYRVLAAVDAPEVHAEIANTPHQRQRRNQHPDLKQPLRLILQHNLKFALVSGEW